MNGDRVFLGFALVASLVAGCERPSAQDDVAERQAATTPLDTLRIEQLTGADGALDVASGVFKVSVPREGLSLTIGGVRMTPPLGLTSWAAFQATPGGVVVAGDLVLLDSEVSPVMSMALDTGLEVTALHNHFAWDQPKVMFMHFAGRGSQDSVAASVGRVLRAMEEAWSGAPPPPRADIDPAATTLDPTPIEAVLGRKGQLQSGVYKVTIGRTTEAMGAELGGAMGVNTWAAFAGSDDQAVVDGDFAVTASELQAVLKALRAAGIHVGAIHNHMVGEDPPVIFLHYWGVGPVEDLARAVRSALDVQGS